MEVAPLPGIFLCLSGVLLCLRIGMVVMVFSIFYLSFFLRVAATLSFFFFVQGSQAQIVASFV